MQKKFILNKDLSRLFSRNTSSDSKIKEKFCKGVLFRKIGKCKLAFQQEYKLLKNLFFLRFFIVK